MKDMGHDIDELFYNGIEGHSEYPADRVWNKIEADLDADKYKRKYKIVKRKAVVLLSLLLAFVLYEAINLYQKGNHKHSNDFVAKIIPGQQHGSDENKNTSSRPVNSIKTNNDEGLVIADHTASLPNHSGDVSEGRSENKGTGQKSVTSWMINSIQSEKNSSINRSPVFTSINDEMIVAADVEQNNSKDTKAKGIVPTLTINDSWKKDVRTNLEPSVFIPGSPRASSINAKILRAPGFRRFRFSLSAYFSPNFTWNAIKDDRGHRNRRNGNNNNNIGGGNNVGNNNAGNNGGGNNGGNNSNNSNSSTVGGGRGRDSRHHIRQDESQNLAYSAGIKLAYALSKKISLETGVNYLITSTNVKPKMVYAEKDNRGDIGYRLNCSSGYSFLQSKSSQSPNTGDSVLVNDTRNSISYIGVPVAVQYKILSGKRFTLTGSAGGQVNILVSAKTKSTLTKGTSGETVSSNTQGLETTYLSLTASLVGEIQLTKRLSFTLAPVGQFGLTNINKRTSVKTRPQYIGLASGIKLSF